MAQEADDFTVVSIDFDPPNATTDNGVLDAIMNRVRPRTIDVSEEYGPPFWDAAAAYTSKYLGLLARGSFLNSLQIAPVNVSSICRYHVSSCSHCCTENSRWAEVLNAKIFLVSPLT